MTLKKSGKPQLIQKAVRHIHKNWDNRWWRDLSYSFKEQKVSFFDRKVLESFAGITAVLSTIATLYSVFGGVPEALKGMLGAGFVCVLIMVYLHIWARANCMKEAHFRVNGTHVNVIAGDLFKQEGLKVIAVNDFFDTIADDKLVAKKTIHGKFLELFKEHLPELDQALEADDRLKEFVDETDVKRETGKSIRYQMGCVFEYQDFVLTPFAHFDPKNKAYITSGDYLDFFMKFWENVDEIYNGRTLSLPLMGAGITRFRGAKPSKQELLELMLWTLKISGFQCTYSDQSVNIVLTEQDAEDIDFFRLEKGIF